MSDGCHIREAWALTLETVVEGDLSQDIVVSLDLKRVGTIGVKQVVRDAVKGVRMERCSFF